MPFGATFCVAFRSISFIVYRTASPTPTHTLLDLFFFWFLLDIPPNYGLTRYKTPSFL